MGLRGRTLCPASLLRLQLLLLLLLLTTPALSIVPLGVGRTCPMLRDMVLPEEVHVEARSGTQLIIPGDIRSVTRARYGKDPEWTDVLHRVRAEVKDAALHIAVNASLRGEQQTASPEDAVLQVTYVSLSQGGIPDFTSPLLSPPGLHFFAGLSAEGRYGCATPVANDGPLQFATKCGCPTGQICKGKVYEYLLNDSSPPYTSKMGQCGCCSLWLILLIIASSLCCFALMAGACKKVIRKAFTVALGGRQAAATKYRGLALPRPKPRIEDDGHASSGSDSDMHELRISIQPGPVSPLEDVMSPGSQTSATLSVSAANMERRTPPRRPLM